MDSNAALAMMRVQALVAEREGSPPARALAETVRALDEWLSRGGFPPEAWREGPDADDNVCVCCKGRPGIILRLGDWVCGACESYLGTHPGEGPARADDVPADDRCPRWLGWAESEGGQNRCALPAGHAGSHDARGSTPRV